MGDKLRINEIQKDLAAKGVNISNPDLVKFCQKLNIHGVNSHSSSITMEEADKLKEYAVKNAPKTSARTTTKKKKEPAKPAREEPEEEKITTIVSGGQEIKKMKGGMVIRRRKLSPEPETALEQPQQSDLQSEDEKELSPTGDEAVASSPSSLAKARFKKATGLDKKEEQRSEPPLAPTEQKQELFTEGSAEPLEKTEEPSKSQKRERETFKAEIISRPEPVRMGETPGDASNIGGEKLPDDESIDKAKKKKRKEAIETPIGIITSEGTEDRGSRIISTIPFNMQEKQPAPPQSEQRRKAEILYRPSSEESMKLEEEIRSQKRDTKRKKAVFGKGKREVSRKEIYEQLDPAEQIQRMKRRKPIVKKGGKKTLITTPKAIKRIVKIEEQISVGELARAMSVKTSVLLKTLMDMDINADINQKLDLETASILASEFNYEVQNVALNEEEKLALAEDLPEDLKPRPPVVTIMGHVDHGKTSLLDYIRKSHIAEQEAGGITQHIGAYQVETKSGKITFIDTPGHEAFTAMRARGAKTTDIVILVVAADDGVMPQTVEAINHAKEADVPILVAINKCDLPDAKPDKIKNSLMEHSMVSEELGGDTIFVEISAKTGAGIDSLLEYISLQAEMLDLKANPSKSARGVVIESKLDKGRGPVATVLVQDGTLKKGDWVIAGVNYGRVRLLVDDKGANIDSAPPSTPVELLGISAVPDAGEDFYVVANERTAKELVEHRISKQREKAQEAQRVSLDELFTQMQAGEKKELKLVIKSDVQGTSEALTQALEKIATDEAAVKVIHKGVGAITENDVMLAAAANGIIIGFRVRPDSQAKKEAEKQKIDIRIFNIIYDAVEQITAAVKGLSEPKMEEILLGRAEVREVFSIPKVGKVAGVAVIDGKVLRNAHLRLIRDNVQICEGKISSLKRFKNDVREVTQGFECGIGIENWSDIQKGDIIEAYEIKEVSPSSETQSN
ncbi:MAG: translation initiation factor IF-2 [Myxococcota bacterium]